MKQIDERRYLWLLRVFALFITLSIMLNVVLIVSFEKIAPKTKWEAFFVQAGREDIQTLYIKRSSDLNIYQNSVGQSIAKIYITQYVIDRETLFVNPVNTRNLLGLDSNVFFLSSEKLYKEFYNSEAFKMAMQNPKKEIITVSIAKDDIQYHSKPNEWEVFATLNITDKNGLNKRTEVKKIKIKANFLEAPIKKTINLMWKNPLGFVITEYDYVK